MTLSRPSVGRSKAAQPRSRPPTASGAGLGADLRARVLYRDNQVMIVDKPAGVPVHAGPRATRSVESMLGTLRFGLSHTPVPAHRLDHDTSGCLILARNDRARSKLGRLFSAGRIDKVYWAIVGGAPLAWEGRIELPLRKITGEGGWRMVADQAGQPAVTDFKVLGRSTGVTWLELRPRTGRTHQLRVHCALIGCPILGDPVYGAPASAEAPLHLFARAVTIPFYEHRPPFTVEAPPPAHMLQALAACGGPPPS
jgi:tRNA pseudouridine32 synthase/23S rRNA pseudouridine746 synthase/23S rRNA pseudouridine1911/1915/1917 synthase